MQLKEKAASAKDAMKDKATSAKDAVKGGVRF